MNTEKRKNRRRVLTAAFFLLVMAATFAALLGGQDLQALWAAVRRMDIGFLAAALALGLCFVCGEGVMIWYLLSALAGRVRLGRCIRYSFIGFFYSGITPSATGGQPMQLYYMCRDGSRAGDATVVLMAVATLYKLVLVVLGLGILVFWGGPLRGFLGGYFWLYLLGLCLNLVLVVFLTLVMLRPGLILGLGRRGIALLSRLGLMHEPKHWEERLVGYVESYAQAVDFFRRHKGKLGVAAVLTFLQRSTLFVVTWLVYRGMGQQGTDALTVCLLQAAVYIAVDMLPLPGSQGVTELVYGSAFARVFAPEILLPSLLVTRGINFYFLLAVSLCASLGVGRVACRSDQGLDGRNMYLAAEKDEK